MSLPARLARTLLRWRSAMAAQRALSCAVYGDCERGHQITAREIERGPSAVRAMTGAWCAAIVAEIPRRERRANSWVPSLTGIASEIPVRDAVAAALWTTRLVPAHARRDWPTCRALVDAIPAGEIETHLAVLLHAAAAATVAREDERW